MSPLWRYSYRSIVLLLALFLPGNLLAQLGKDGAKTVTAAGTIVNEYTTLTADALAGTSMLTVTSSSLNANGRFPAALAPGDLVLIIQIQGASMTSPDDSTYGTIISMGNCGRQELAEVAAVPTATSIQLSCALQNSYTWVGRAQVVRVPRYASITINSGGTLTCPNWNGSTGGVLALEVQGNTVINSGGRIDVTGLGFRGGQLLDNNSWYGVGNHRWMTDDYGAEKGEGVLGYQVDYDMFGGRYCRGAAINAGGGGNGHNAGGGGGGNAGNLAAWTGSGNPDVSNAAWAAAWNLEYSGFAGSTSSGGGRGGYTFSSSDQNALSLGPFNSSWGGDQRRNNGGMGGRPLDYSTGRIFLGGGGGSGDQNDSKGGPGGNGGGLAYLFSFGDVSGAGEIRANGSNGVSTSTSNGTDGAGGGGAGGTVILKAGGTVSGVSISANGGNGGNQVVNILNLEAEGPGGGGGGGYIGIGSGAPTCSANGGANGTTNSRSMTEFPPNGATRGGAGLPNESVPAYKFIYTPLVICPGNTATINVVTSGTPPATISYQWYTQAVGGVPTGFSGVSYTTPPLFATDTFYAAVCPGHYRYPFIVQVDAMTASFTPPSGCTGQSLSFSGTGTSSMSTISGYSWNFGDGSPASNSQNTTHTYSSSGNYTVTLTVTNASGCTMTSTQTVAVSAPPVISVSPSVTSGCGPLSVNFSNSTTGATSYSWNFGDGSPTSSSTSPTHVYTSNGTYTVTMTATNASGCSATYTGTNLINVANGPTASFSNATPSICLGDTIRFTNLSTANGTPISGYSWDFDDGTPASTQTSPTHIYTSPGTYAVTLTTSAGVCSDDTTINVTVNPAPVAAFTAPTTTGCGSLAVAFNNTTTGSPVYTWNFGDGTTSALSAPTHIYSTPGTYTVTLIATQGSCADTLTRSAYITVNAQPTASFSSSAAAVCLGDTVFFTNLSSGNGGTITGYAWDFDDGNSSTATQPFHLYTASGTYAVLLTTATANCSDDTTINVVVNPAPVVSFSTATTSGCTPLTVAFTNTTTGSPGYNWSFGDGGTSTSATPTHTYTTSGNYTVTLIATQGSCADTLVQTNYIQVSPAPTASFTPSATAVCLGDVISFTDGSSSGGGTIVSYQWDYDDGNTGSGTSVSHTYTAAGNYNVTLSVSTGGCVDDTVIAVAVNPAPVAAFSATTTTGCAPLTVSFTNSTSGSPAYSWTFGDGGSATTASPSHTYTATGTYTVTLIATQGSCADTLVRTSYITIATTPTASFSTSNVCLGDPVSFSNSSLGNGSPITGYTWDFGDGSSPSTSASPMHNYAGAGTFAVTLTADNGSCSDDTTISVTISPAPVAAISASSLSGCAPLAVNFSNTTTGSPSYSWAFGDGGTSAANSPSHTYTIGGTFPVQLIATQGSCADTASLSITVTPTPIASFTTANVCQGDSVRLNNTSGFPGSPSNSIIWTFGDGGTSNLGSPAHFYANAGTYTVLLDIANAAGCHDTTSALVTVNPAPVVQYAASALTGCDQLTVNFTNSTTGAVAYSWLFGDGGTSSANQPSHTYTAPGTYTVVQTATSDSGCTASRASLNMITVRATPQASFTASSQSICKDACISFTGQASAPVNSWSWSFSGGQPAAASVQSPAQVCYPTTGDYAVTLVVSDGFCSDTLTQPQFITVADCSQLPVADFRSSDTTICAGDCIDFVSLSLNATNWNWTFQGANTATSTIESPTGICYPNAGIYPVKLIVQNLSGRDTLEVLNFITVHALPATPGFSQAGNVLTAPAATAYQWYFNGIAISGANGQTYTATLSGNYAVEVFDANGCSAISPAKAVTLVGIDELQSLGMVFHVYPNPLQESLHVLIHAERKLDYRIRVQDLLGQTLIFETGTLLPGDETLRFSSADWAAGVYWVIIEAENRLSARMVVRP
ncbi:MAG: PKD domain-containing protein [Bacteroidia bacterium]